MENVDKRSQSKRNPSVKSYRASARNLTLFFLFKAQHNTFRLGVNAQHCRGGSRLGKNSSAGSVAKIRFGIFHRGDHVRRLWRPSLFRSNQGLDPIRLIYSRIEHFS